MTALSSCSSSKEFTGFSYDPDGVTETNDKKITPVQRRTITYPQDQVTFLTNFDGARLSKVHRKSAFRYQLQIQAENTPINNSPWYAFGIQGPAGQIIHLQLDYEGANHRYIPKIKKSGSDWAPVDSASWSADTAKGIAEMKLTLSSDPLWISAQPIITFEDTFSWLQQVAHQYDGKIDTIGHSSQGRPLLRAYFPPTDPTIRNQDSVPSLLFLGRQHPPEVTGAWGLRDFTETILRDTTDHSFRNRYGLTLIPLINPDGVDGGHWRHNGNGIDLNRDWQAFNQPETQAVRQALIQQQKRGTQWIYAVDFHSTDEHILYPILKEYDIHPQNLTYHWADQIKAQLPDLPVSVEPFDLSAPIAKNWFVRTFETEAVTFELNDEADRSEIRNYSSVAASLLVDLLLDYTAQTNANH
ncbi:MAG: M14 family metallopeptidase [Bacteroidota bacterium]